MYAKYFVPFFFLSCFLFGVLIGRLFPRRRLSDQGRRSTRTRRQSARTEMYVGNLSYDISEKDLSRAFENFGEVLSVRIIKNRSNGKSKGFGFVEMADRSQSFAAIRALDGEELKGRKIVVNEARSRSRE